MPAYFFVSGIIATDGVDVKLSCFAFFTQPGLHNDCIDGAVICAEPTADTFFQVKRIWGVMVFKA